ncbi:hypothetical protein PINS_up014192 [Pythium insidiosum]|nr:hypothetical protein PINS_up014192 [Pythium insidiosum]
MFRGPARSPMEEMLWLQRLKERDAESAANVVANGKLLVDWAEHGRLRELQCARDHMDEVSEAFSCATISQ